MVSTAATSKGRKLIGASATTLLALMGLSVLPNEARAIDEIQVYNAEIAEVGQWTLEQHLNYVARGPTQPDFPGGLIPNHSLNGTPELVYGVTDWWELGAYAPFAVAGSSNASSSSNNSSSASSSSSTNSQENGSSLFAVGRNRSSGAPKRR